MKQMLMVTNLSVWSISKGVGAPSFYKTIELYNNNGWSIDFWTTEKKPQIDELKNVSIKNIPVLIPLISVLRLHSIFRNLRYITNQFLIVLIFFLFKNGKYDVIYGYEVEFIPGLKVISMLTGTPLVSRFQGTILHPLMIKKLWRLRYLAHVCSLSINSDLTIMTDDGTLGDEVIDRLRPRKKNPVWFVRNGVDEHVINYDNISPRIFTLLEKNEGKRFFFSVSRLQCWKRVDRSLEIFKEVIEHDQNCFYLIGGDGQKKNEWEEYSNTIGLKKYVEFLGGLNKDEVYFLQQRAHFFLSTYELSNMGNPLFEAMKNECVVATIANGSTSTLIKDGFNGLISPEQDYISNAKKLLKVIADDSLYNLIQHNSLSTFNDQFQSWNNRMQMELEKVDGLLQKCMY